MDIEMHLLEHECNEALVLLRNSGVIGENVPEWIMETATLDLDKAQYGR